MSMHIAIIINLFCLELFLHKFSAEQIFHRFEKLHFNKFVLPPRFIAIEGGLEVTSL